jgi:galactose oxidase-like protein
MAYDSKRREVVVFGGYGPERQRLGDTWIWNGREWRQAPGNGPTARNQGWMAFDAFRGVTVLFGGCCAARRAER